MIQWPVSPVREVLRQGEIHLWAWPLCAAPAETSSIDLALHHELLDGAERRRMLAFHFPEHRERYALVHANLRRILGGYLHQPGETLQFRANLFGKPELHPPTALHFNLSHSQRVALLAVTLDHPLGVDVEDVRPIEDEVAAKYFSARELADLNTLRGEEWLHGFYRCWTRKEAVLKAEGVGLHGALADFDVSLLPDAPAALLQTRTPLVHPWMLYDVSAGLDAAAALATAQKEARLCSFCFLFNRSR